ncbi:MAG: hypothetical protein R3C03_08185 [Pirellulaceae bacterium]
MKVIRSFSTLVLVVGISALIGSAAFGQTAAVSPEAPIQKFNPIQKRGEITVQLVRVSSGMQFTTEHVNSAEPGDYFAVPIVDVEVIVSVSDDIKVERYGHHLVRWGAAGDNDSADELNVYEKLVAGGESIHSSVKKDGVPLKNHWREKSTLRGRLPAGNFQTLRIKVGYDGVSEEFVFENVPIVEQYSK